MTNTTPFDISTNDRFDVVIAGAGFAGLALAKALASGFGTSARIALVTRDCVSAARTNADSRATALSAASVRMLDKLGVWANCSVSAQPVTAIDITDSPLRAGVRPILLSYDNHIGSDEPAGKCATSGWASMSNNADGPSPIGSKVAAPSCSETRDR